MRIFARKHFDRFYFSVAIITYLLLGIAGVTTSNISLNSETAAPNMENVILGSPRAIRSDEFLRWSPARIGEMIGDKTAILGSNLEPAEKSLTLNGKEFPGSSEILNPENSLFNLLPIDMGFALFWWFGTLIFVTFSYALLRKLSISKSHSLAATSLVLFSAPVAWWSLIPLNLLGNATCATYFAILAINSVEHRSRLFNSKSLIFGIISGYALTRLAFNYLPWALPIGLYFGCIILAYAYIHKKISVQKFVATLVPIISTSTIMVGYIFFLRYSQYASLAETLYPGQRRSNGAESYYPIFSGPFSWLLQSSKDLTLNGTNQSEAALGPLILILISALLLLIRGFLSKPKTNEIKFASALSALSLFFLSWSYIEWPERIHGFIFLGLTPGIRMAQILGLLSIYTFFFTVVALKQEQAGFFNKRLSAQISIFTFLLTAGAGSNFIHTVSKDLVPWQVLLTSSIFATCIYVFLFARQAFVSSVPLMIFSLASVYLVNPVSIGVGDLYHSSAASTIRNIDNQSKDESNRWVTDDPYVDALVLANGLSQVSGQQLWGPNPEAWQVLDPTLNNKDAWNRGASYVRFEWVSDPVKETINSPQGDIILVSISPCSEKLRKLHGNLIISSRPLNEPCLSPGTKFYWQNLERFVYTAK